MKSPVPAGTGGAGSGNLDLEQMRPPGFLARMKQYEQDLTAKVSAGSGWIDNDRCLVCASTQRRPQWPAHALMLYQCLDCGHYYFEKMPRNLAEVYEGESYLEESKAGYLSNLDYRLRRFATERLAILD